MRLAIVFVLIAACLSACASLDRGREDAELRALSAAAYDSAATRALETNVLAHAGARAKREGDALSLATENGGPVVLTNKPGCEDTSDSNCIFFTFAADLASRHAYVVAISYYEGSDFLLIDDRSGRRTEISGAPRFAPGEDALFVTIDNDGEFDGPSIEIWRRTGDTAAPVFSRRSAGLTTFEGWDAHGIHLTFESVPGEPVRHWKGTVSRDASGWHFSEDPPAGGG
jgi:hypothetical protein